MSADHTVDGGALAHPFTTDWGLSDDDLTTLLGGKGAGLVLMKAAGIPVPDGFTMTTDACRTFLATGWSSEFDEAIVDCLTGLQQQTGKTLGSAQDPLLVSVRSGAMISMPGMMDTVLNVGMNHTVEQALADRTGNTEFAADTHRRAMLGFAELVLGAPAEVLQAAGSPSMTTADLGEMLSAAGYGLPEDPHAQVLMAVRAVFESWQGSRAERYREIEGIDHGIGTAATVQAMVFGNLGDRSGTGVAFSRNPTTGESGLVGDFLVRAQGEDVVAGEAMTEPLSAMETRWPDLYSQLSDIASRLEAHYRDMVDLEFTVEDGQLWLLQSRRGKRSPIAAFRAAIDMAEDPDFDLDRAGAVQRCERYFDDPPTVSNSDDIQGRAAPVVVANGLGASPGIASGVLCLDPDRAVELHDSGLDVILARQATSPADVHGMAASKAIFTTLGGQVSHAALVAREWGLPAVVGASDARVESEGNQRVVIGQKVTVAEGETVTVDGDTGRLLLGVVSGSRTVAPEVNIVKQWADALDAGSSASTDNGAETDRGAGALSEAKDRVIQPEAQAEPQHGQPLGNRVLHALRIKGMITAPAAAAICDTDEQTVTAELTNAVDGGFASFMEARQMWLITPEGRSAHPDVLAGMIDGLDLAGLPYQRFLELNDDFKRLCTEWQLRNGEPNDHTDAEYDAAIFQRLVALDDQAQPIIASIGAITTWMAQYGPRLASARERLIGGDQKALTGVMCESYHDVWMELHEDLILTQGIDRAAEGST